MHRFLPAIPLFIALFSALPAAASVSTGVQKWNARDWSGAVEEWVTPAARGDADALFNLGQAYKLGRGVAPDLAVAQDYYRRAAAKGHVGAAANLGISLYQDGRKTEALGHLREAADKGDGRAAYVIGVATFNGDGAPRNQTLGYAYMLRAREGGLAQAEAQAARMATILSAAERSRGEAAAAALAAGEPVPVELTNPGARPPAPLETASAASEDEAEAEPAARPASPPPRSSAPQSAARNSPAPAGATASSAAPTGASAKTTAVAATGRPLKPDATVVKAGAANNATVVKAAAAKGATAAKAGAAKDSKAAKAGAAKDEAAAKQAGEAEGWRVQLGAFANEAAARTAWATLVSQSATILEGTRPVYSPRGRLVRLQLGPYSSRASARELCAKLSAAGRPCFVTEG